MDLQFDTEHFSLFRPCDDPDDPTGNVRAGIPSLEKSVSIRPKILIEDMKYVPLAVQLAFHLVK